MSMNDDLQTALSLLQEGRHKAAFKVAKRGMVLHKTQAAFPNIAGIALCSTGKQADGIKNFRKALQLDPDFHDARKNLAQTLTLTGQPDQAEAQLARLLRDLPGDGGVWYLMAQARMASGNLRGALEAADRAVEIDPGIGRNYNLRALLRDRLGQAAGALEDFEHALRLNPDDVETLINVSLPLARQTYGEEALAAVRQAVELAPNHVGARLRLAAQLVEMGQETEAAAEYRQALKLAPGEPEALEALAQINGAEDNADLAPKVMSALKKAPRKSEARAALLFATARIAEQAGDATAAAGWLKQANAEMAAVQPFDSAASDALNDLILSYFPDPVPTEAGEGITPIYVLGLPRSGTTLAEAILGAHPTVKPLGERATAGILLYPLIEAGKPFGPEDRAAFRDADRQALPALPEGTRAYVDKMPENYRLIGFLKTAYPNARIVNLQRDPRDVALSMWRGHFSGRALSYTYDLQAMAGRFNGYARMMAHWHRIFPGQILDLPYEDMVADVETASRQLAEFCGLDWTPAMARPDLAADQVLTLSASQLRQPVHSRSVGGWRKHAETLQPFIAGLDPGLWPQVSIG